MQLNGISPGTSNRYTFLEFNEPVYYVYVKIGGGVQLILYLNWLRPASNCSRSVLLSTF